MNSHELAKQLLKMPVAKIGASVDISTSEDDSDSRVYGDLIEINGLQANEVTLLFVGSKNK